MMHFKELVPLDQIEIQHHDLLSIKRNDLVPILNDQSRLNYYADQLIQAQSVMLKSIDSHLTQLLSKTIMELIEKLNHSRKYLKNKKFNALQKWLGWDVEYDAGQIKYLKDLDILIDRANHLSQKLQIEIQKSQSRFQQLLGYREQMAKYIVAAQEFLHEYPEFVKNQHPLDNFSERLSKKINTLQTVQSNNDIAIMQMQLSQQLSFNLLDRYKEAQQVLIPAWQYHVKLNQESTMPNHFAELNQSREKLIKALQKTLEKE
ncbi:tellurium resistance protein [Acinetobacter stercoris]|uniref:Tellurium resistance protein n=1 Tax=Acinetobacter stercoris TaxID=2126983 RepID=A0A2U3MWZ2_9GAMM|nr:tellurium resistance protein [Acinetobacter stercoris]SPL69894.1 hypothetical protein KPC_1072 [Acinetobacter stercoris]